MKKAILLTMLALLMVVNAYAKENNYNPLSRPCGCVDQRWEFIGRAEGSQCYYDPQTVEILNKYNPFADKQVKIWVYKHTHYYNMPSYTDTILHYTINLDNRTYQFKSPKGKVFTHDIKPSSNMELVLNLCKKLYDK